jgi:hypothetical protein
MQLTLEQIMLNHSNTLQLCYPKLQRKLAFTMLRRSLSDSLLTT